MASELLVNTDSSNGVLPDGTKPIPDGWTNVDLSSCGTNFQSISQEMLKISIHMSFKNTLIKLLQHLPGANELNKPWVALMQDVSERLGGKKPGGRLNIKMSSYHPLPV